MQILAIFTESSVPKESLEPTISIWRLDTNALAVEDAAMVEVGNGQYSYDFATWDRSIDYSVICDSVTLTGSERYAYSSISQDQYQTELERITANVATEAKQDIIDTVVDGIQADLDNPVDGLGALKLAIVNSTTGVIEDTLSSDDILRLLLSKAVGIAQGGGSTNISFRSVDNTKDRIRLKVDTLGNRSNVVLDPT